MITTTRMEETIAVAVMYINRYPSDTVIVCPVGPDRGQEILRGVADEMDALQTRGTNELKSEAGGRVIIHRRNAIRGTAARLVIFERGVPEDVIWAVAPCEVAHA